MMRNFTAFEVANFDEFMQTKVFLESANMNSPRKLLSHQHNYFNYSITI